MVLYFISISIKEDYRNINNNAILNARTTIINNGTGKIEIMI